MGRATYRKRDLRVAREIAHEGDVVEIKPDGTITIITGKQGEEKRAASTKATTATGPAPM
jgi:hypothetical protein